MVSSPIRPPAVAGLFYDSRPEILLKTLKSLLEAVPSKPVPARCPKALVVPHAGYVYSGPVAAGAFELLEPWRNSIRRVILLGPAHRVPVQGLALPGCLGFETPLGIIPLDIDAFEGLGDLPQVVTEPGAHTQEHSIEVQLPFLQTVLDQFKLVPLVVGRATAQEVSEVLDRLWGGTETLIIVSTDLSHYHPYDEASRFDLETARTIASLGSPLDSDQACGAYPLNGLIRAARSRGLQVHQVGLANSGDTAGDKTRVVGYGAFAFYEGRQP